MTIEINYDPMAQEVSILLDNSITLEVTKDARGRIKFSESFEEVDDDKMYDGLIKLCKALLAEGEEF